MQGFKLLKPVAMLQLVVLLFLQLQSAVPALSASGANRKVTVVCSGDCTECGCSPERIASGTCCCAMQKKLEKARCCENREPSSPDREHFLKPSPCGKDPTCLGNFFSCEAYILPRFHIKPNTLSTSAHTWLPERLRTRFDETPVPPHEYLAVS